MVDFQPHAIFVITTPTSEVSRVRKFTESVAQWLKNHYTWFHDCRVDITALKLHVFKEQKFDHDVK